MADQQINELSKKTLKSYIKKAHSRSFDHGHDASTEDSQGEYSGHHERSGDNRQTGMGRAAKKLGMPKRSVETAKKASREMYHHGFEASEGDAQDEQGYADHHYNAANRKIKAFNAKIDRIKEEEDVIDQEQINELSRNTLKSYVKKAAERQYSHGYDSITDMSRDHEKDSLNRAVGTQRAIKRLGAKKSVAKKINDGSAKMFNHGQEVADAESSGNYSRANRIGGRADKQLSALKRAVHKLTKEQEEEDVINQEQIIESEEDSLDVARAIVESAVQGDAVEVQGLFESMLVSRAAEMVEIRKLELTEEMFGDPDPDPEDEEEPELDFDDEEEDSDEDEIVSEEGYAFKDRKSGAVVGHLMKVNGKWHAADAKKKSVADLSGVAAHKNNPLSSHALKALGVHPALVTAHVMREDVEGANHYEFTHGKKPRGKGSWFFSKHKTIDFGKHKEGEDHIEVHNATYGEAKKKAMAWAREKGHRTIHVQT